MLSAEVLRERAVVSFTRGRLATAMRQLDTAWRRTSDPQVQAKILVSQAYGVAEQGDPAHGLDLCRQALELPDLDEQTRALVQQQAGTIEMRRGNLETALQLLSEALEIISDDYVRGVVFINRGTILEARRQLPEAAADFQSSYEHLARAGDTFGAAQAQHNLGCIANLMGDLPRALSLMAAARPHFDGEPIAVVAEKDRAEVLVHAGRPKEAARVLRAAVRGLGSRRMPVVRAELDLQRAKALLYVDPAQALVAARRAASRFARQGSTSWSLVSQAVAAQAAAETSSARRASITGLDELTERLRRERFFDEATVVSITAARTLLSQGRVDEAHDRLRRLRMPATASLLTRLLGYQARAETSLAAGRTSAALGAARRGVALLRGWESRITAPDLQRGLAMHGQGLLTVGLDIAARSRRPDLMLEWSERARGMAAMMADPFPGLDPVTTRTLEDLRALGPGASDRHDALQTTVRDTRWAHAEAVGEVAAQAQVTLSALSQTLTATATTMIAYLNSPDGIQALVVSPARVTTHRIGAHELGPEFFVSLQADLEMAAAVRGTPVADVVQASLDRRLRQASRLLVEPLAAELTTHRVMLAVPGRLTGMPWTMLPDLAGRSVTVSVSATRWVAEAGQGLSVTRRTLVAGPDVPRADEEVIAICGASAARVLTGDDATVAAVVAAAQDTDLLHLVGHGSHSSENPLFSRLELADGPWWGYDVAGLASVPPVVVLSACDLGQGSVTWGDEALGMARAWLHAGARAVIAAPALVNDDDATRLLPRVHARIAAGEAPADALSAATADLGLVTPFVCYGTGW